jgi:hypothetical protein
METLKGQMKGKTQFSKALRILFMPIFAAIWLIGWLLQQVFLKEGISNDN